MPCPRPCGKSSSTLPADAALMADLGVCDYLNGRADDATRELETAVRLDPRQLTSYVSLGAIQEAEKRYDKALAAYERARPYEATGDALLAGMLAEGRRRCRGAVGAPDAVDRVLRAQ